jgi:hypothetical protein
MSGMSEVSSSPSLAYPGAPANTPATQSLAGDAGEMAAMKMSLAADIDVAAHRLSRTTSPSASSSTGGVDGGKGDAVANEVDPFKEGKARLRSPLREDTHLHPQLFKSPKPKRALRKHEVLKKYVLDRPADPEEDRSRTPTHLSFVTRPATSPTPPPPTLTPTAAAGTFEYSAWSSVAEEDTQRALKRMAMLAHDEYVKDPRRSVQEYYSMRLAKLIEEAEVAFDAAHLQ